MKKHIRVIAAALSCLLVMVLIGCSGNTQNDAAGTNAPAEPPAGVPYTEKISRWDQRIYAGPGYDYECVGTVRETGVYTIVEEVRDEEGSLWGKLKSGAGWVDLTDCRDTGKEMLPISANYANDVALSGEVVRYTVDDSEYSVELAFVANETLTDVSFSILELGEGDYEVSEVYCTMPELAAGSAFVPSVCFYGDFTMYKLSFIDAKGAARHFCVVQSGRNGELILNEREH